MEYGYYDELMDEITRESDGQYAADSRVVLSDGRKVSFHEICVEISMRLLTTQTVDEDGTPTWEVPENNLLMEYSGVIAVDKSIGFSIKIQDSCAAMVAKFSKDSSKDRMEELLTKKSGTNEGRLKIQNLGYGKYAGQKMYGWQIFVIQNDEVTYILRNGHTRLMLKILNELKDGGFFAEDAFYNLADFSDAVKSEMQRENKRIKSTKNRRSSTPIYEVAVPKNAAAISYGPGWAGHTSMNLDEISDLSELEKEFLWYFVKFADSDWILDRKVWQKYRNETWLVSFTTWLSEEYVEDSDLFQRYYNEYLEDGDSEDHALINAEWQFNNFVEENFSTMEDHMPMIIRRIFGNCGSDKMIGMAMANKHEIIEKLA